MDVTIGTATAAYKQLVLSTSRKVLQQKRELRMTVNTRRRLLETCLKLKRGMSQVWISGGFFLYPILIRL